MFVETARIPPAGGSVRRRWQPHGAVRRLAVSLFAAGFAVCSFSACGGGGAPPEEPFVAGAYAARIIATKRSTGSLVNFDLSATYRTAYAAYGESGLVTMDLSDLSDIRITRRQDDVRSSDVRACGRRLYSLDFQAPPFQSRVATFDIGLDPTVPVKLGEVQLELAEGAGIACAGDSLMVSAGARGLYRIDAQDIRYPEATFLGEPADFGVVSFYGLKKLSESQVLAVVELPPDPGCFPPPTVPCEVSNPDDPRVGRLGIRTINVSNGSGTSDRRIPQSASVDFPFLSGINQSPINFPVAAATNGENLYVLSSSGRRLTAWRSNSIISTADYRALPPSDISDIASIGELAVVADGDIRLVDVSDPTAPKVATTVVTPGSAFTVQLRQLDNGDFHAYVADGENGLVIIGIERIRPTFVEISRVFTVDGMVSDMGQMPAHVPTSPLLGDPVAVANFLNGGLLVLSRSNGGNAVGDNIDRTDGGTNPSLHPAAEISGGTLFSTTPPRNSLPGILRLIARNIAGFLDFEDVTALNTRLLLRGLPLVEIPPDPDFSPIGNEQLGPLSPFHAPTGIAVQNDGYPFVVSSGLNLNNIAAPDTVMAGGRAASIGADGRPVTYIPEDPLVPAGPLVPAFPPRRGGPVTGVWWGEEDMRACSQLPTTRLPFRLRAEVAGSPAGLPCGSDSLVPAATSNGLSNGLYGVVFGGAGADNFQADNPLTPGVDYFTRNPVYFAATGDGGVVQIDLDSGVSQLSPPCTLRPLNPLVPCAINLAAGQLITDDPSLKHGMLYTEDTRTLFVADPVRNLVQALSLGRLDAGTIRGVYYRSGGYQIDVSGLLSTPVDLAPTNPPARSPDHLRSSSDLYILNRGSSSIVKTSQAGDFIDYIVPRFNGQTFDAGRFSALAASPDGTKLYLAVEDCPTTGNSCIFQMPAP